MKRTLSNDRNRSARKRRTEIVDADKDFIAAFQKGLSVIEAFDANHSELTPSDIASKTGITRAGARRYLLTLTRLGFAQFDGKFFSLTPRVLRLGHTYLAATPLARLARPVLQSLTDKTRETASLVVLDGMDGVFIAHSFAPRKASLTLGIGTRLPAHCNASGRILLGSHSDAEIARYLQDARPARYTNKTVVDPTLLRNSFREARRIGYAVNDEEYEIGLRTIAVPVNNSRDQIVAALTVSVFSGRLTVERMIAEILPPLKSSAKMLASML